MHEGEIRGDVRVAMARNAFSNAAMEAGFDAFLPVCPGSVDVILYRREDGDVRLVLLRDRWTVGEEHECLQVSVAFEARGTWYLVPIGTLGFHAGLAAVEEHGASGTYDLGRASDAVLAALDGYRLAGMRQPTIFDRPPPYNAALLACFQAAFRCRDAERRDVDGAISGFIQVIHHAGWTGVGYDDEAVEIASSHTDEVGRLGRAAPHRLASVLAFLNSAERHAGGWFEGALRSGLLHTVTRRAAEIAVETAGRRAPVLGERITGALIGASIGDALGLAVHRLTMTRIIERFGREGLQGFAEAYGRVGALSGEAQIMLCVAAGLAEEDLSDDGPASPDRFVVLQDDGVEFHRVRTACRKWRLREVERDFLREVRPHGRTTALALATDAEAAANDSKGSGCMLRAVPIGLSHPTMPPEEVFLRASRVAGMTHGHPAAKAAAGVLATLLSRLVCGQRLEAALDWAVGTAGIDEAGREVKAAVDRARVLAGSGPPTPKALETLGGGHVAGDALAIALCCVLSTSDYRAAVLAAVNHSGDSDATGAIAGAVAGALYGTNAIPLDLLRDVEGRDAVIVIAA